MTRKNVDECLAACKTAGTVPSLVFVCRVRGTPAAMITV